MSHFEPDALNAPFRKPLRGDDEVDVTGRNTRYGEIPCSVRSSFAFEPGTHLDHLHPGLHASTLRIDHAAANTGCGARLLGSHRNDDA